MVSEAGGKGGGRVAGAHHGLCAAIEFKAEGRVLGTGAKMFTIAGPVIVYGTLAAVVYGAVLWVLDRLGMPVLL